MTEEKNKKSDTQEEQPSKGWRFSQEQYEMLLRCSEKKDMTEWNEWVRVKGGMGVIHLEGADLSGTNLSGALLATAYLEKANFSMANLNKACLVDSFLDEADLSHAMLKEADLEGVFLKGANLYEADFTRANLRRAKGMKFDSTCLSNAILTPWSNDHWSKLRRNYTGPKLAFHLILLLAFILPYAAKACFWVSTHQCQQMLKKQIENELNELTVQIGEKPETAAEDQAKMESLSHMQRFRVFFAFNLSKAMTRVKENSREFPVWKILLGIDKGLWYSVTAILLIAYNLCRFVLTRCVGPLCEEENRTGVTPPLKHHGWGMFVRNGKLIRAWSINRTLAGTIQTYGRLIWVHRVAMLLFWVAVISFLLHFWDWMTSIVMLPI